MLIIPTNTKALDYSMDNDLANADASFIGEDEDDYSGLSVAGLGDVNGDGYDDILIGAWNNNDGGADAGQTYLILGNASGWTMDNDLANADASFIGEDTNDWSGNQVAGAGDVNGDGYDDILIGAVGDDDGGSGAGQTYLILGNASGWTMDNDLANVDASFIGEDADDRSGFSVAGAGDVNDDGYDDILIGAWGDEEGGNNAGQTYLILGNGSGWSMDTDLVNANASFIGEDTDDESGRSVAGAGDVNGDGYDDILIGAWHDEEGGGDEAGQTYLILGNASGWTMDNDLSNANASFWGEDAWDWSGRSVAGAGDVNGDGYDDILIGAWGNDDGGSSAGQTYLILGKATGWVMDTDLANADASFIGEDASDRSGESVAGAGDVNGDGYDDILIGAWGDDEGGNEAGQTYLILGKSSGWAMDTDLANADASFWGEDPWDWSGRSVAGAGDVNGDGYDDILIGAYGDDDAGYSAGQTYLIFPDYRFKPSSISSVKVYSNDTFLIEISMARMNDTVYIELLGTDGNASRKDFAFVNVRSNKSSPKGFNLKLYESDLNTGKFRSNFTIRNRTHDVYRWINASIGETITISSIQDPSKNATIFLRDLVLYPIKDDLTVQEDGSYNAHYSTIDLPNINWLFETNASWLKWNETSHNISGTPDNRDVGSYWVRVNITKGPYFSDEHNFTLVVNNTPPDITIENIITIKQNQQYIVDYNSSDDGQGIITWHLSTNASWLQIDTTSGNLTGIPTNADVGSCWVNVSVDDGNGGWDSSNFTLNVINKNDPPEIVTDDLLIATEDEEYKVTYEAVDIDYGDTITWHMTSNTSFLAMDSTTGELFGIPTNDDVGTYWVNVTVSDIALANNSHNFTLTVLNVNDPPVITKVNDIVPPANKTITMGKIILGEYDNFTLKAEDIDGDVLDCKSNNQDATVTGVGINLWNISFHPSQNGKITITFTVSDDNESDMIYLTWIVQNPLPPILNPPSITITGEDNKKANIGDKLIIEGTWLDPDIDIIDEIWVKQQFPDGAKNEFYKVGFSEDAYNELSEEYRTGQLLTGVYVWEYLTINTDGTWKYMFDTEIYHSAYDWYMENQPDKMEMFGLVAKVTEGNMIFSFKAIDTSDLESNVENITIIFEDMGAVPMDLALALYPSAKGPYAEGATVTITIDGEKYSGKTNANGIAIIKLPFTPADGTYKVKVTHKDYEDLEYDLEFSNGEYDWLIPNRMKLKADGGFDMMANIAIILVIIIVIIIIIVFVLMLIMKKKKPAEKRPALEDSMRPTEVIPPTEVTCTACGQMIPIGSPTCPACGMSSSTPPEEGIASPEGELPSASPETLPEQPQAQPPPEEILSEMQQEKPTVGAPLEVPLDELKVTTPAKEFIRQTAIPEQPQPQVQQEPQAQHGELQPQEPTEIIQEQPTPAVTSVQLQPQVSEPQLMPLTTLCPLCQQKIQKYTNPCPHCGGMLEWG